MNAMVRRFQRSRWSLVRVQIDGMMPRVWRTFPVSDYYNVKSSVERLNDAYMGERTWGMSRSMGLINVVRIK